MSEKSILIVDERGSTRVTWAHCLQGQGYAVQEVDSLPAGIRLVKTQPFSLIIVGQPESSAAGLDFLKHSKELAVKEESVTGFPVYILCSDYVEEGLVKEAWTTGFRHVISRGISQDRLLAIVSECLSQTGNGPNDANSSTASPLKSNTQTPQAASQRGVLVFESVETGQPGLALIGVSGTLSRGSGFEDLTSEIVQALRKGQTRVILDLRHVTYINSSGVSGLIGLRNRVAADGGTFSLVNAQSQVITVLANLNLLKVLNCAAKPIQSE